MEDRETSAGTQMGSQPSARSIFGEDGKLSSASAATSLKYAKPQDLPSFPSAGLQMSSAGAAASMASSNRKSFEHWKPEPIPAANRAALLAKDYEMEPLWQPSASAAGSKAAIMAQSSSYPAPPPGPVVPAETHKKALMAATSASHNRRRSGSMPTQTMNKPPQDTSQWALKAATKSHKAGPPSNPASFTTGDPGFEAARIQNVAKNNVDRQLYTASPPVSIEVQEKNRQDTLRASAIAMAQKMYAIQQRQFAEAAGKPDGQALAASRARGSTITGSSGSVSDEVAPFGYENLEEAARKLAQERLAKIHDEHAEYRSYYGQTSPARSRLSMRGRPRASSAAGGDDSDEESTKRIRSQMSIFQSKLAQVDSKKRQQDRDNLLQIAHRNVDARIRKMDNEVFQETGKASPAQMEQWEKSAREKAQKDSDERMQYAGKVHIGGGKYLDQSELDAIARARLQPTLDEISEKAEQMRAKDEAERQERERLAAEAAALKKMKEQQKQEERTKKEEEKRVLREQQAAEKAKRDEEKRILREQQTAEKEKRKGKDTKPGRLSTLFGTGGGAATGAAMGATGAETSAAGLPATGDLAKTDVIGSGPYEEIPEGETFHDQVTSPTFPDQVTHITALSAHDQVTSPTAPTAHNEVTSSAAHDQVTSPTAPTAHNEVTSPAAHAEESTVQEAEPSAASPADTQVVPATTTTTETATTPAPAAAPITETPSTSVSAPVIAPSAEIPLDNRNSVEEGSEPAMSPTKPSTWGIKSWMKVKFRGKSNTQEESVTSPVQKSLIAETQTSKESNDAGPRANSMHNVAMAGREKTNETEDMYGADKEVSPVRGTANIDTVGRSSSISSISSDYSEGEARIAQAHGATHLESDGDERGRQGFKDRSSKNADGDPAEPVVSNTEDEFEEARDTFEEEKLAPPPPLSTVTGEEKGSKALSPKGSREGSRFTEEL